MSPLIKTTSFLISIIMCIVMCLGCLTTSAEVYTGTGTIKVTDNKITQGDNTASIKIVLNSTNPGLCAVRFKLIFDNKLTLSELSIPIGSAYSLDYAVYDGVHYKITDEGNGKSGIMVLLSSFKDEVSSELLLLKTDIELDVTFNVPTDIEAGDYQVSTSEVDACDQGQLSIDNSGDDIISSVILNETCGTIKVEFPHVHTPKTKVLTSVTDTQFIYTCTCESCSETYTEKVDIGPDYTGKVRCARNIFPESDISLRFEYPEQDISSFTNFVLIATKQNVNSPEKVYFITNYKTQTNDGIDCYQFVFDDITAYQMNDNVNVKLYGLNSNNQMSLLKKSDYSVKTYASNILNNPTTSFDMKKLLIDMLNYGAASQIHKKYDTDNLVNSFLTAEQRALGTPESEYPNSSSDFSVVTQPTDKVSDDYGTVRLGKSLLLQNKINILIQLDLTNFTGICNNLYLKIDYYDTKGQKETPVILSYTSDIEIYDNYPSFIFEKSPISTKDYPILLTLYYGNPNNYNSTIVKKYNYSIETYMYNTFKNMSANEDTLRNLLQTMYVYGNTVAKYFNIKKFS